MFEEAVKVLLSPNLIQAGGIVVAVLLIGVVLYMVRLQMTVVEKYSSKMEHMMTRSDETMRENSNAKIKLAENMAIHTETIKRFHHLLEKRL